ncbi:MAG: hypothetical protein ACK5L3_02960 [Oscillospiraceae bacterium]
MPIKRQAAKIKKALQKIKEKYSGKWYCEDCGEHGRRVVRYSLYGELSYCRQGLLEAAKMCANPENAPAYPIRVRDITAYAGNQRIKIDAQLAEQLGEIAKQVFAEREQKK